VLLVVMLALIVLVPLTLRVVMFVTAPPKLALPVTVRLFAPPSTVLVKVTVLPDSVRPPAKVTAPVYACVLLVVMLALMVLVPLTLSVVMFVTAPPKLALPVTIRLLAPPSTVLVKVTVLAVNVRPPASITAPV